MPDIDTDLLEKWLSEVARCHNRVLGPIVYLFCDDEKIIDVNRQFLNHDFYTDVITFDYSTSRMVSGDIVISLDTVESNARQLSVDPARELRRVIAHGVLHLCGIDDKGPGEREIMERHEDEALSLLDRISGK
ncbi:MAG: rRNA maturation RNase YbeY [Paramuribaculum sp.]|nr:rRNA maturation RNase YbeY [Paramuribaculum sp.]